MEELYRNLCTKDELRFVSECERIKAETKVGLLWLDFPVSTAFRPTMGCPDPEAVLDKLSRLTYKYGLQLFWVPTGVTEAGSIRSGGLLARTMWNIIYQHGETLPV